MMKQFALLLLATTALGAEMELRDLRDKILQNIFEDKQHEIVSDQEHEEDLEIAHMFGGCNEPGPHCHLAEMHDKEAQYHMDIYV